MYIIYNTEFDQSIQLELYKENGAVLLVKRIYRVLQKRGHRLNDHNSVKS